VKLILTKTKQKRVDSNDNMPIKKTN